MIKLGDKITVQADEVLGTPETEAVVTQIFDEYLMVICDDDPEQWEGPVTYDGQILQTF